MPLSEIERRRAEVTLREYCARRLNPAIRDKLEIVHRIEGNFAYISERRPEWRNPSVRRDYDVAKFRFSVQTRKWSLYWSDRNLKWHLFEDAEPSADIGTFLPVVDSHPIFYG